MKLTRTKDRKTMKPLRDLAEAPGETLLSRAELAELFGCSTWTLIRRERRGELPPRAALPGRPRYSLAAVRAFLASGEARAA